MQVYPRKVIENAFLTPFLSCRLVAIHTITSISTERFVGIIHLHDTSVPFDTMKIRRMRAQTKECIP